MKVNYKKFSTGGYEFKDFKGNPINKVIDMEIPQTLTIPLKQGFGGEVSVIVKPGEYVKAGQIIGIDKNAISSPVHSSINGIVEEIKTIKHLNKEVNAVVIKSDGTKEWQPLEGHSREWNKLSTEQIQKLLYMSGVTSLDKSGIPTIFKSSVISPEQVENVIVYGIGTEPFNISLSVLLQDERKSQFVTGLKILKKVMSNAKFYLAVNKKNSKLIQELNNLLFDVDWIELYALPPKYPLELDEVLIPTILGKKYPYGYLAANIGVIALSMQTVTQVYDAVVQGKPLIERTVALGGTGWKENVHMKVRVGTSIEDITSLYLKEHESYRLILNSMLTNKSLTSKSLPMDRTSSVLIALKENKEREVFSWLRAGKNKDSYSNAFLCSLMKVSNKSCDTNIHGEYRSCISCGFCEDVCPVDIIPHLIQKYVKKNMLDEEVIDYGIFNCIGCNLCSYVCTSKIDVAKDIREGQEKLTKDECGRDTIVEPYFDLIGLKEFKNL